MKATGNLVVFSPWLVASGLLLAVWGMGTTDVVLANAGFDRSLHDAYYVVSHTRNALWVALLFVAAIIGHFVMPYLTGRRIGTGTNLLSLGLASMATCLLILPYTVFSMATWTCQMPKRYVDYVEMLGTCNQRLEFVTLLLLIVAVFVFLAGYLVPALSKGPNL
jgi:cytochrome c oxidase subunit 1